ncbi:MAG: DUF2142 domain-containing protein [Clostridiales Family XIII bacterium]|jgi:uncharacterized membrane protein|nr:DUF2142 domain-containing protein [Clostridiales Family XIII bacterium]
MEEEKRSMNWGAFLGMSGVVLLASIVICIVYARMHPEWSAFSKGFFTVLAVYLVATGLGVSFFAFRERGKLENLFFFTALAIGFLYIFILPPNTAPDEQAHFTAAYADADVILGAESKKPFTFQMRVEDLTYASALFPMDPTEATYQNLTALLKDPFTSGDALSYTTVDEMITPSVPNGYFPQTVGILLGRIFHFSFIYMYILGRFMNLLCFALLLRFAIKLTPIGKGTFAVIGLFPMCMELAASYSYDAVIIGTAFLAVAYWLYLYMRPEQVHLAELALLFFLLVFFIPIKAVYVPFLILTLFLPARVFIDGKQRAIYYVSISVLILAVVAFVAYINIAPITRSGNAPVAERTDADLITVSDFFAAPLEFFRYLIAVPGEIYEFYYLTMIGGALGPLTIGIGYTLINLYCLTAAVGAVRRIEAPAIGGSKRTLFVLIIVGVYVLTLFIFYITWTPVGAAYIQGIQGRYFLPVLPLLAISLFSYKKLSRKWITDKHLLVFAYLLQCVTVLQIFSLIV